MVLKLRTNSSGAKKKSARRSACFLSRARSIEGMGRKSDSRDRGRPSMAWQADQYARAKYTFFSAGSPQTMHLPVPSG